MRTIDDVIAALPRPAGEPLPKPEYLNQSRFVNVFDQDRPASKCMRCGGLAFSAVEIAEHVCGPRVGLAVESMRRHTTDEGWQIFKALEAGGYRLNGHMIPLAEPFRACYPEHWTGDTNVSTILADYKPSVVVLQDKREWEGRTAGPGFDQRERFTNVGALRDRPDIFKLTILKDTQHDPAYHRQSADEIGCHAWIVYYHPRVVAHLAPFVRPEHLVRTWHTVDAALVPPFSDRSYEGRQGALLSGAMSDAYPLRRRLFKDKHLVPGLDVLPHPGYRRDGCRTPEYLKTLSRYKVAICTSSVYGYALRKIVEATSCGCVVVTDLPVDDELPGGIDENLVRIGSDERADRVGSIVKALIEKWDPDFQQEMSERAKAFFDYRAMGRRLADDIEKMRRSYNGY